MLKTYRWIETEGNFDEVSTLKEALKIVKERYGEIPKGTLVIRIRCEEDENYFYLPLVPERMR